MDARSRAGKAGHKIDRKEAGVSNFMDMTQSTINSTGSARRITGVGIFGAEENVSDAEETVSTETDAADGETAETTTES